MAGCVDPGCAHRQAADRARRRNRLRNTVLRRRASRQLDRLTGVRDPYPTRWCDGGHHPGLAHDWWSTCSGAAYTPAEARRLRAGVAA